MLDKGRQVHHFSECKSVDQLDVVVPDQFGAPGGGEVRVVGLSTDACVKYLHCCAIEFSYLFGVCILQKLIQIVFCRGFVLVAHVGVLVRGHLGAVGQVHVSPLVEGSIDVLLIDVLDHGLIVVTTELLVVVVNLHPRPPPSSPCCHPSCLP